MSWRKVKIGEVLERKKNLIEIEDDKEYKLVTVKLYHKGVTLRKIAKGSELGSSKMHSVKTGEFILSGIDARHGAFGIIPAELEGAVVSNDFWCLAFDKEVIEKQFFLKLTSTTFFDDLCKKASDGTTNRVRLQADKFFNLEITLPSIKEQKDFVQRYSKLEESNHAISAELNHQLSLVKELRQAYLREAMQGKLALQDSTDEPAEILLEKIKAEKEKLVAEKKIKRDKPLPPIKHEEIPFEIPSNWTWCRLGEICSHISDIDHNMPRAVENGGVKFLSAKDLLDNGTINFEKDIKYISEEDFERLSRRVIPQRNDIIYSRIGAKLGKARVVESDEKFLVSYSCCTIRTLNPNLLFLNSLLDSGFVLKQATRDTTDHSIPDLGMQKIKEFLIQLPPLAEQERIVAKLERLMKFCDELEINIKHARANANMLLQVALKEALESR
ncbi:MAG: type restriction enzyme subunit [Acidobacteriota bacterium]|jgi:type I restriction enzyme S subunit|nr:type restriction enzyme subunit [Acidobacteriota bacterium]